MTGNDNIIKCPQCGATMAQVSADTTMALYRCSCCGYKTSVSMSLESNAQYWEKKTELMARTYNGIAEWQTTNWNYLRKELLDFMARYEDSQTDIRFKMAVLACITHGFHYMTIDNYKECKAIFKTTEKLYKGILRSLKQAPDAKMTEQADDYKKNRTLYKKCRNEYRNTKIAWKVAFTVLKKFIPSF